MKYIYIFSISPVQKFIEQSRKTKDMYAASQLLSHFTKIAAEKIGKKDVIFPLIGDEKSISVPNRFIARVDMDETEAQSLGYEIEKVVKEEFISLSQEVLKNYRIDITNTVIKKQLDNYFEVNWLFYPETSNYVNDYNKAEQYFGALKNMRNYGQSEENGKNCSVCGERNVVLYKKLEKEKNNSDEELRKKKFLYNSEIISYDGRDDIKAGEGLCSVCLIKRGIEKSKKFENMKFPSVSEIVLYNILDKMETKNELKKLIDVDLQLLFDMKNGDSNSGNLRERIESEGISFEMLKKEIDKIRPYSYYAIVAMDIDNLGKYLSGEGLDEEQLLERHKVTAEKLNKLAATITEKIKKPCGEVVYAGGDDFLFFINIEGVKDFLIVIDKIFKEIVGNELTFSMGIAIAHRKAPLGSVVANARVVLKEAKNFRENKSGVGFYLMKHSGEEKKSIYGMEILDEIEKLYGLVSTDFSSVFIKNIGMNLYPLVNKYGAVECGDEAVYNLINTYTARVLQGETNCEKKEKLKTVLTKLYRNNNSSFSNYIDLLEVVDFIKRNIPEWGD